MREFTPQEYGRLAMLIDRLAARWDHRYDRWCVTLYLATVVGRETHAQAKRSRRVGIAKWKQDMKEGKRLVKEGIKRGGRLDCDEVRGLLSIRHPPEW